MNTINFPFSKAQCFLMSCLLLFVLAQNKLFSQNYATIKLKPNSKLNYTVHVAELGAKFTYTVVSLKPEVVFRWNMNGNQEKGSVILNENALKIAKSFPAGSILVIKQ